MKSLPNARKNKVKIVVEKLAKKNEQSAKIICGLFFVIMSRNDVYLRY